MKNDTILRDCIIPVGYDSFIHHFHIFERSVAETNDILMIKMCVRCKEHSAAIKFIVHFFSIYVHHCTLIIWLPIAHQTEMTEEHHKGQLSQMGIKQNSWKVCKDLQLFSLYSYSKYKSVLIMFVGKFLLYEVLCVKHEHTTQIQCVYCSELLLLIICSFCIYALFSVYIVSKSMQN